MPEGEFLISLLGSITILAGFVGVLYSAYTKTVRPLVDQLNEVSKRLDAFTHTLKYMDKKIEPIAGELNDLEERVGKLETSLIVLKVQLEYLKENKDGN